MKKTARFLCLLLALMVLPLSAVAAPRLPAMRGNVTDDANVLNAQTASEISRYAEIFLEETGIQLHVAIVHFLDGLDAQTYAERLFHQWGLGEDALLLLAAAGEDSCATVMGKEAEETLGRTNAENLMYTSSAFLTQLRAQQYDAAFGAYFTALNALAEKQTGAEIRLGSLFGSEPEVRTSLPDYGSQLWDEVMAAIESSGETVQAHYERHEQEEEGLTAGGWIVLLILVFIVIRQSRPLKHGPRRQSRSGCGCSPLGWIIGLLGLGFLFDRD